MGLTILYTVHLVGGNRSLFQAQKDQFGMSLEVNKYDKYIMVTFESQPQYIIHIAELLRVSGRGVVLGTLLRLFSRPAHDVAIGRFLLLGQTEGPHIAIAGQRQRSSDFRDHGTLEGIGLSSLTLHSWFTCSQGGDSPGDLMQNGLFSKQNLHTLSRGCCDATCWHTRIHPPAEELRFWRCHDTFGTRKSHKNPSINMEMHAGTKCMLQHTMQKTCWCMNTEHKKDQTTIYIYI